MPFSVAFHLYYCSYQYSISLSTSLLDTRLLVSDVCVCVIHMCLFHMYLFYFPLTSCFLFISFNQCIFEVELFANKQFVSPFLPSLNPISIKQFTNNSERRWKDSVHSKVNKRCFINPMAL